MNVCMAQVNTLVGDIAGNPQRVLEVSAAQKAAGAHVMVFPELTLTGYPPEDLLLRGDLLDRTEAALAMLCAELPADLTIVVGYPRGRDGALFNSAGVISAGKLLAQYDKQCLPNYEVFDEKRYFDAGTEPCVIDIDGLSVGLTICEDIWHPEPAAQAKAAGAEILGRHELDKLIRAQRLAVAVVVAEVDEARDDAVANGLGHGLEEAAQLGAANRAAAILVDGLEGCHEVGEAHEHRLLDRFVRTAELIEAGARPPQLRVIAAILVAATSGGATLHRPKSRYA